MANNNTIVFSWKITDTDYGYLWTPKTNGPCIANRITANSDLEQIVGEISTWDASTYEDYFNQLSNLIYENFSIHIEGDYSNYYHPDNSNKSYIMLTGKDGATLPQDNNAIDKEVLDKLKNYIVVEVSDTTQDVKSDVNNFKASVNQTLEIFNRDVNARVRQAQKELADNTNNIINRRLTDITNQATEDIMTTINNEIPISALQELIEGTEIREFERTINDRVERNTDDITNLRADISAQNGRIEDINNSLNNEIVDINQRIIGLSDNVMELAEEVERYIPGIELFNDNAREDSQETVINRKSAMAENETVLETETIDNEDGTYDIISRIGEDTYNIRILSSENKLKTTESNQGLTLANNGFKYLDKSGSFISLINGTIKLSNSDGSGKLEIKKDGLYINGVKQ